MVTLIVMNINRLAILSANFGKKRMKLVGNPIKTIKRHFKGKMFQS